MALPLGTGLQFRYEKRWASRAVLQMIEQDTIEGQDVLVAYVDQSSPLDAGTMEIVPVRKARIISAAAPGSTLSLVFSLGRIVHSADLATFNREIAALSGGALPKWTQRKPTGLYCAELNSEPTSVAEIADLGGWELVVDQLSQRRDFDSEETFLTVVGLLTLDELARTKGRLRHMEWPRELPADRSRELVIYHYHGRTSPTGLAIVATAGSYIALESSARLSLDSRYDLCKFRVRTGDPGPRKQRTWISLSTEHKATTEELDLDLEVTVRASLTKQIGIAAAIAVGLTVAQVATLVTRSDLSNWAKAISGLFILAASVVVAVAAVWHIRKSV